MQETRILFAEKFPHAKAVFCYYYSNRPAEIPVKEFLHRTPWADRIRFVRPEQMPTRWRATDDQTDSYSWRRCSAPSIRGHIVNGHLKPFALVEHGTPAYDLEVLVARGFDASWIVRNIHEKLERSDEEITSEINAHKTKTCQHLPCSTCALSVLEYKAKLVKILLYVEQLELEQIDWKRVERAFADPKRLSVDLMKDSCEGTFFYYAAVVE